MRSGVWGTQTLSGFGEHGKDFGFPSREMVCHGCGPPPALMSVLRVWLWGQHQKWAVGSNDRSMEMRQKLLQDVQGESGFDQVGGSERDETCLDLSPQSGGAIGILENVKSEVGGKVILQFLS